MKTPFIPSWLFDQGFNSQEFSIYCYVAMRGDCWESKRTIAQALGMSKDSFYRHLNQLIKSGWVTRSSKGRKTTLKVTDSGKPIQRKCLISGTRSVASEGHEVSHSRDTRCRTSGTLTNQRTNKGTNQRTNHREEVFVLVHKAGQAMRGSGPTLEDRQWREVCNG